MPIYSFGKESPLKLEISEEDAAAYNRVTQAFFDAQIQYKEEHGTRWEPAEPLWIKTSEEDMNTYNRVGAIFNREIENFGRPIHEDELTEDFLVKND